MSDRDLEDRIAAALTEIDAETRAFGARTGLACPPGCGACCLSPDVETTPADMIPMAGALLDAGHAAAVLDRLTDRPGRAPCVLYQPDPLDPRRGRCAMYARRPSICRLFAFAGRRDAEGTPQFTPCRVHMETLPDRARTARDDVRAGTIPLPIFADHAARVAMLAPGAMARTMPINDALRGALEKVGLARQCAAMETASALADACTAPDTDDSPGSPRTPRPVRPMRPAA
ncbi:MAG: YkgJ family cysteine cluster protein [Phycisphaeraceae bacterium]|nr:YkgJ family cysteine cluster protein [Phycisphaeraceae bacterium]